ncbi:MAG: prevent-host-death protein [Gammaproteobacteria bacterium]|nr:prevent-host-death protein [Gammaproteobacteria bacterium]
MTEKPVSIDRGGREPVASDADELSSWLETAYLLRSPRNAHRLRLAGEQVARGEGEPMDVGKLRARFGLYEG